MPEREMDRIRRIFDEVVEATGEERDRLLARLTEGDAHLRSRVEELLAAHERPEDLLDSPTVAGANAAAAAVLEHLTEIWPTVPGTRIGPYKLLERIGEGGFGVVYMAEQDEPIRRRVALKIIKPGMDTKEVIARFEAERQALALMNHPGIARVFDAGTTEGGRPYFVMELVRGVPINEYCDENRLSTRERLLLFREVCNALHHAHRNGIIHRDIKPSNILVTLHDGTPVSKIIDFGVAKAIHQRLTEKTLFTNFNQFIGTPTYMSPEQAIGGMEIDARSDIYSLGVLLYELLTGTTPFDSTSLQRAAYAELVRILREDEPPRPSTRLGTMGDAATGIAKARQAEAGALARLLRGDLDWIVMRALEKKPTRRYETAAALAADITHFFDEEPVTARPPSAAYRLEKFARKRRRALATTVLMLGAAVAATSLTNAQDRGPSRLAAAMESNTPTRRLVLDRVNENRGWPVREGGHYLRYDTARGGFELLDIATRRRTPLTRGGPADFHVVSARLTTERNRIAAVLHHGDADTDAPPGSGALELRLFDVASGNADGRLLRAWAAGNHVWVFGWSPDEQRVWTWVIRADQAAEIGSIAVADGSYEVLRTLTWRSHSQNPSLSPDGRFIAYHDSDTRNGPADVFLLATDGTRQVRLEHPADDAKPIFAPDGSGIVFVSDRRGGGVRDLWFQPVTDGRPVGEPRIVYGDVAPMGSVKEFAGNGSLYYYFATTQWEIYTARIAAEGVKIEPQHLPPRGGEMNNGPSFSPDGRYLAHLRDRGRRLVIRELESGAEREVPLPSSSLVPTTDWCNDETVLVHAWMAEAVVYRVDIARGSIDRVALASPERIACVDAGRSIVYMSTAGPGGGIRIARRTLETGAEIELFAGHAIPYQLQRSADGSHIGFVEIVGDSARIVVVPSTGGDPNAVMPVTLTRALGREWVDAGFMFDPRGGSLIVARAVPGASPMEPPTEKIIWRVPLDGTSARRLGTLAVPQFENGFGGMMNFTIHPDGQTVAFERHAGTVAQDWAIDGLLAFIHSGVAWNTVTPPTRR